MGWPLRVLAACLGVFLIAMAADKFPWIVDGGPLLERFQRSAMTARPEVRWYLETIAIPASPLFARLVPLGELATGIALVAGLWPRLAAAVALFMVLNFHFATGSYWSSGFLRDGAGLPVIGGLVALVLNRARLPWTITS